MKLINKIRELPGLAIVLILIVTVYIAVKVIRLSIYLGYRLLMSIENLLRLSWANPFVMWGIFGIFIGSIFGVIVAVKRYKLSKKLVFYPLAIVIAFIIIMAAV